MKKIIKTITFFIFLTLTVILGATHKNFSNVYVHSFDRKSKDRLLDSNKNVMCDYKEDFDRAMTLTNTYTYSIEPFVVNTKDGLDYLVVSDAVNETDGNKLFLIKDLTIQHGWPLSLPANINDIVGETKLDNGTVLVWVRGELNENGNKTSIFYAISENGVVESDLTVQINEDFKGNTIFTDVNGDGGKEFIMYTSNEVFFYDSHFKLENNWPKAINDTIFSNVVVTDVNGDDINDIVTVTSTGEVYAWELNGSLLNGYPFFIKAIYKSSGEGFRETPIIIDSNKDGIVEMYIASTFGYMYCISLDGFSFPFYTDKLPTAIYALHQATAVDIDKDGFPEIIQPFTKGIYIYAFNKDNNDFLYRKYIIYGDFTFYGTPTLVDINKDNYLEIVMPSQFSLIVFCYNGTELSSLEKKIPYSYATGMGVLAFDCDNDHQVELVYLNKYGQLSVFEYGDFGFMPWVYKFTSPLHSVNIDNDGDGLLNYEEKILGTDSTNVDTDSDGINDGLEVNQYALNPLKADQNEDTDMDNLTNIAEVDNYSTNPLNPDTDFDTLSDGDEILIYHTNPLNPDTDEDGIPDPFEVEYNCLNPLNSSDANLDSDKDNLTNLGEFLYGTDPTNSDTDGDGLLDGDEINRYFTNPLIPDENADYDGDGLTNVEEVDIYHTDPTNPDSDGDGYSDGLEVKMGSDPLDPNSMPKTSPLSWTNIVVIVSVNVLLLGLYKKNNNKQ